MIQKHIHIISKVGGRFVLLGVDLGNVNTKTSENVLIKSKYTEKEILLGTGTILELEDKKYCIGEGQLETKLNKTEKRNLLPLLYAAIALSTEDLFNSIVIGLPPGQYKENKRRLKEEIPEEVNFKINNFNRKLVIKHLEVFPEGAGAYYSLSEKPVNCIVTDIGGRTTNILLFQNGELLKFNTLALGMLNIYSEISISLNNKFCLDLKIEDIESIMENGLFIDGEKANLKFLKNIIEEFLDQLFNELNLNYPIRTTQVKR